MRAASSSASSGVIPIELRFLIPVAACARPSSVAAIRWMVATHSVRDMVGGLLDDGVSSPRSLVARPRGMLLLFSWVIISRALVASSGSGDSLALHMRRALW
jgi:hypothetical protein